MFTLKRQSAGRAWDLCASGLSAVCMLHCLGLPLVATLLPVASQVVDSHTLHVVFVALAIPVTLWVVRGESVAGNGGLFAAIALCGLALMVTAVTLTTSEAAEVALTLTGGTMLAGVHLWRWVRHPRADQLSKDDA